MKLSTLKANIPVSLEWEGNKVQLDLNRLLFKEATNKDFQNRFEQMKDDPVKLADAIAPLIAKWDITDDADKPLEITAAQIADFPTDFVALLAETVLGKLAPPSNTNTQSAQATEQSN